MFGVLQDMDKFRVSADTAAIFRRTSPSSLNTSRVSYPLGSTHDVFQQYLVDPTVTEIILIERAVSDRYEVLQDADLPPRQD